MRPDEMDGILAATLADNHLSRGERHALRELLEQGEIAEEEQALFRHRAFELARARMPNEDAREVLTWLEGVVKLLHAEPPARDSHAEVHFSPGPEPLRAIVRHLEQAKEQVDVCVFTITDDRLAEPLMAAHGRGVRLRIITDGEKAYDLGSDVEKLARAGIEVRVDPSEHHMHHKFAIFDDQTLITGSYNWTRSAAEHNQENILITDDARIVAPYRSMFERFWVRLRPR